jgi:plastocyanin
VKSSRRAPALLILPFMLSACGGGGDGGGPNPSPATIAKAGAPNGDGQSGAVGLPLVDSFRVVVSEGGAAKAGVTVTWTSPATGAVLSPVASTTNASGRAASRMSLGHLAGGQTARASISNSAVTFNVAGSAGAPAQMEVFSGNDQAALVNLAISQALRVQVKDQFGNPVSGTTVNWSIAGGSGNLSGPASTTGTDGVASVSLTVGGTSGQILVRAVSAHPDTVIFTAHAVTLVKDVLVKNNFFESGSNGSAAPSVDTIPAGEAVRWVWQSAEVEHNIISQGPPLFQGVAGAIKSPFTYGPIRFAAPGSYQYHCNLHPGMDGQVVVQ